MTHLTPKIDDALTIIINLILLAGYDVANSNATKHLLKASIIAKFHEYGVVLKEEDI